MSERQGSATAHRGSFARHVFCGALLIAAACKSPTGDDAPRITPGVPLTMTVLGEGTVASRYTGEVWVRGSYAYTTTWATRTISGVSTKGNAFFIWNISGSQPQLIDSVIVPEATTLGDVQISPDGR